MFFQCQTKTFPRPINELTILLIYRFSSRLQNSPYFCVFKYARAVKQKVWNEAENRERDWGETLKIRFFSLASHALRACEARALRARKTLTPRFTNFFTDFEKKPDCFAVPTWKCPPPWSQMDMVITYFNCHIIKEKCSQVTEMF